MLNKDSSISVIIPLYNQGKYVEEALNSVFNQTHKIDEIIVINDGSTDNGLEVINNFKDKITIINKANTGSRDSINEGLKIATGNFLAFLDADDRWIKNKTEIQLQLLENNPDIDIVFGNAKRFCMVNENDVIREKEIDILPGYSRQGGLFRRTVFERIPYKTEISSMHDFIDWYNRAKEAGVQSMSHPEIVFERRIHDSNEGIINKERQRQQYFTSIKAALDRRRAGEKQMKHKTTFPLSFILPSITQQCLLNCCITNNKEEFIKNWTIWKSKQDFDLLNYESQKLIPALNEQLLRFNVTDENQPRYQGIYKKNWVMNHQLFLELLMISEKIKEANIPFKIIKSVALTQLYYNDNGLLKIYGGDIFISNDNFEATVDVLLKNGYRFDNEVTTLTSAIKRSISVKQIGFKNNGNHKIVLHNHPFRLIRTISTENLFWNNGSQFKLNETLLDTFNPTQHLFYITINGISETAQPMLQWAIDLKKISETEAINWDEFIFYAKQFNTTLLACCALAYLSEICMLTIPKHVITELSALNNTKEEVSEFNNFVRKTILDKIRYSFVANKQLNKNNSLQLGYLDFLKLTMNVKTLVDIPIIVTRKLFKKL
jgi:glycosyltransferase involved in cell wall biosynthesis